MRLQFSDVISFVQDYIPATPQAKIGRKLNLILEDIYTEISQVQVSTFTTRAPTTSGTVTATNNSNAVSFSGTPLLSTDPLQYIQIDGSSEWYELSYVSTSTGTLSSVFEGTTGAGLTYTIAYPTVSFPSAVQQVLSITKQGFEPLKYSSKSNLEERGTIITPAQPVWYSPYLFNASTGATPDDAHRILLLPFPDAQYTFSYTYMSRPALLSVSGATTQYIPLPSLFNRCVQFGTLALCYGQDDGEGALGPWWGRYLKELTKATAVRTATEGSSQSASVYTRGRRVDVQDQWPIG